jgi:hypothetical protein
LRGKGRRKHMKSTCSHAPYRRVAGCDVRAGATPWRAEVAARPENDAVGVNGASLAAELLSQLTYTVLESSLLTTQKFFDK